MPIPYIKTIAFLSGVVYKYMIGNVNQSVNIENFVKRYDHHDRVVKRIIKFIKETDLTEKQYSYIENVFIKIINTHYNLSSFYDDDYERGKKRSILFDEYLKENLPSLYDKVGQKYKNIYKLRVNDFDKKKSEKQNFETIRKIKRVFLTRR